uniref:Uncharacterized protein n=1 Tax=Arundo donax TaxID=35708 RepID=A0A0A8XUG7_ARUDO
MISSSAPNHQIDRAQILLIFEIPVQVFFLFFWMWGQGMYDWVMMNLVMGRHGKACEIHGSLW